MYKWINKKLRNFISLFLCVAILIGLISSDLATSVFSPEIFGINTSEAVVSGAKDLSNNSISDATYTSSLNAMKNNIESSSYQWTTTKDGSAKTVTNIPISNWTRSSNYISWQRRSDSNVQNDWNWTTISSLNKSYTNPYQVWDGSRNINHYYTDYLGGKVTMYNNTLYDSITWVAPTGTYAASGKVLEDLYKFEGNFKLDKTYDVSDLYFTLSTVASDRIIYLNDNIYVFIYPTNLKDKMSNSSSSEYYFMNFLCYWTGTIGTVANVKTFHGVSNTTAYSNLNRFSDLSAKESALNYVGWNMNALTNNVGSAISRGYSLATNSTNINSYSGDYTVTIIGSDISGGGGMYRPILGVQLASTSVQYIGNESTSGTTASQDKKYGVDLTVSECGYKRTGYSFQSWNTKADGTGTTYKPGDKFKLESGAMLYAIWEPNDYTVTLYDKVTNSAGRTLGTSTWNAKYNTSVNGSSKGTSTTVGAYYTDYKYASSSSATVTTSGATVYRYFTYSPLNPTVNSYSGTYDGKAHSISVSCSGATVQYCSTQNGTYTNTAPTYTNAGTYTTYYKVSESGYTTVTGSSTVTIAKANNTLTLSSSTGVITYPNAGTFNITKNTSGGTILVNSSNNNVATATLSNNAISIAPGTTSGTTTITVTAAETTNYNSATASYTITVNKGTIVSTVKNYSAPYDGNAHSITVTATTPQDATITYSTSENGSYDSTNPSYTNAGTYTTYYKITRPGYNDFKGSGTISISKIDNVLELEDYSETIMYPDSTNSTINISKNISGGTISASSSNKDVATVAMVNNKPVVTACGIEGTSTITVTSAETTNYKSASTTFQITVEYCSYPVSYIDCESTIGGPTLGGTTKTLKYNTKIDASILGTDATVGKYYDGYKYISSTTGTVTNGSNNVYRIFQKVVIAFESNGYTGTYDGNPHSIFVTNVNPSDSEITYSTEQNGTYSSVNPTYTNAGTYTTYFKIEKDGYITSYGAERIVINKANNILEISEKDITMTYPASKDISITKNLSGGTISVQSEDTTVVTPKLNNLKITNTPGTTTDKKVNVTITSAETTNYNSTTIIYTVEVKKGILTNTSQNYSGVYDGNSHSINVTSNGNITYIQSNGNYEPTIPSYTNAGEYKTYWKSEKPGYEASYGNNTVTISKAQNTLTLSLSSIQLVYPTNGSFDVTQNISEGKLNVASSNTKIASATISGNKVTIIPGTSAGKAIITVTSEETTNYLSATKTFEVTVIKGTLVAQSIGYKGIYDSNSHSISVSSTPEGNITYSLENGVGYQTSKPDFTNAGSYIIYYKVSKAGYDDYLGSETVTIGKANGSIVLASAGDSILYPEATSKSIKVNNNISGGVISSISSNESIATAEIKNNYLIVNATGKTGTAIITVTSSETNNYYSASTTYKFTVGYSSYNVNYIDVVDSINGTILGQSTEIIQHNVQVRGEDMGKLTTDNIYYPGYYYSGVDTKETVIDGGVNVYRIFKLREVNIPVTINWVDNNNKFSARPSRLQLSLRSNTSSSILKTITISGDNSTPSSNNTWQSTFGKYPMYDSNGTKIVYTVTSSNPTSLDSSLQYNMQYNSTSWVLTNTLSLYTPTDTKSEYGVTVKGNISWKDESNKWSFRPQSVDILLYQNDKFYKKLTLEDGQTTYEFTGLPKFDDNEDSDTYFEEYNYSIIERSIDNYNINYNISKSTESEDDGLGNITKVQTQYCNISNIFAPEDGQTIRESGRNTLVISPQVFSKNNEIANVDDFGKLNTNQSEQNILIKLKQLNLHWNPQNIEEGRYVESYNGYSGLEFNVVFNMSEDITIDYIMSGKYELCFSNNNQIKFEELEKLNSNNAIFTKENGKYYVTYSYLNNSALIKLNQKAYLNNWMGYTSSKYSNSIVNMKTK